MNEALGNSPQCPFGLWISHIPAPFGDFHLLTVLHVLDGVTDECAKEIDHYVPSFQGCHLHVVIIDDPLQNVKDYQSPIHDIPVVHHSKNAVYTIVALITFLFCGTLVGTLLFNSFAMEETPKTEISSISDSISANQLQIVPPVYSHETYHINRNFRRIYNTLEAQQKINMELTELTKKQQIQISTLAAYVNQQTSEIERYEREHNIYKWMTSIALLLLSSLLLYLHLRKS